MGFWGLENVNIVPAAAAGSSFTWSPGGQTNQNITVSPTTQTNYTLTYTDGVSTCSTSVVVDVAPPVVIPSIVPNPFKSITSVTDLTMQDNFNTCNYSIYLYDNLVEMVGLLFHKHFK